MEKNGLCHWWDNWIFPCEEGEREIGKKKIISTLTSSDTQKIDMNWIRALNVKAKTIKLLKENIGENLCDLGIGKYFLEHKKHKT